MSTEYLWNPAVHQSVMTSSGSGVIEAIQMTRPMEDDECHLRFVVRMISGNYRGELKTFGVKEITPLLIRRNVEAGLYR